MADDEEEIEMQRFGMSVEDDNDVQYLVAGSSTSGSKVKPDRTLSHLEDIQRPIDSKMKLKWYKSYIPPEPIRSSLYPPLSVKECKYFIFTHFPILGWLWSYQYKYLVGDAIAGVTVAVMHIPQGLAYGQLAGLPPVYGLYGSFVPVLIYSLLGTSRHISVGTFAVVSLMVFNSINRVFESNEDMFPCLNSSNGSVEVDIDGLSITCDQLKVEIAVTLAFISGLFMFMLGLLKFGFITILLSDSLVSGYTTGAAVHVFTSQAKHIFGLQIPSIRTIFSVPKTWYQVCRLIVSTNIATLIISIITIAILIIFRIIDRKLLPKLVLPCWLYSSRTKSCSKRKVKWPIPLPSQLIVVTVAALISYVASFEETFDVAIVKDIPPGLPNFTPPKSTYMLIILQDAAVISIVTFSVAISLAQVFAKEFKYTVSPNQEFMAYGAMNLIGSLFGSLNTAGSLSRSTVQAVSGGKTQLVGFISSGIILLVLVVLGPLFEPLPNVSFYRVHWSKAVLASIIWVALYGMFSQAKDIWKYWKLSPIDMATWIVVFLATVLLGVDIGLGIGVTFSLVMILGKIVLPKSTKLAKSNTDIYCDIDEVEMVQSVPGLIIYRFQSPLCFINCKVFQSRLDQVCGIDRMSSKSNDSVGCIQTLVHKFANLFLKNQNSLTLSRYKDNTSSIEVHTLILDCSPIGFMDAMGVKTIQQLVLDFDVYGIQVIFAALTRNNRDMLERVGFFDKCGNEWLFHTVRDAVEHALDGAKLHPGYKEEQLQKVTNIDEADERENV